jgi:hypothetical protein
MRALLFLLAAVHLSIAYSSEIASLPRHNFLDVQLSVPKTVPAQRSITAFPKIEWPHYYEFTLKTESIFGFGGRHIGRLVLVPFDLNSRMFGREFPFTAKIMTAIVSNLTSFNDHSLDIDFPEFPDLNARRQFFGEISLIKTSWGKGVLYLTQYSQEAHPSGLNNENIVWRFQGVTIDQRFYVSAFFFVQNKLLPSFKKANMPEGQKITGKAAEVYINQLPKSSFRPDVYQLTGFLNQLEIRNDLTRGGSQRSGKMGK